MEGIVLSPTSMVTGRAQITHVTDTRVSEQYTLNTKVQCAGRHQVNPNQKGRWQWRKEDDNEGRMMMMGEGWWWGRMTSNFNNHMQCWVWKKKFCPHAMFDEVPTISSFLSYLYLQLFFPYTSIIIKPHWVDLVSPGNVELQCSSFLSLTLASVIPWLWLSSTCNPWSRAKDNTLVSSFCYLSSIKSYCLRIHLAIVTVS